MSNIDKKQYKCILPTNGYVAGDIALLTDAEVANFNGGEMQPRFVPVEEKQGENQQDVSGEGEENKTTETTQEGDQPEAQPNEQGENQQDGEAVPVKTKRGNGKGGKRK